MKTMQNIQKGSRKQLMLAHSTSAPVVSTRSRRCRKGTTLIPNFTVKKLTSTQEEDKFETVIDNKLEVQRLAELKQNHTMVLPKLNFVKELPNQHKKVTLRGKKRAEVHNFMKELVQSNKVSTSWNIDNGTEVDELDHFFNKKQRKPFRTLPLEEWSDKLSVIAEKQLPSLIVPDEKRDTTKPVEMKSIQEQVSATVNTSDSAVLAQLSLVLEKVSNLEKECEKLKLENQKLKEQLSLTPEVTQESIPIVEKIDTAQEVPQLKKLKERKFTLSVQTGKSTQVVTGIQQSLDIQNSQIEKEFKPKPQQPKKVLSKDNKVVKVNKLKQWYSFDKTEIEKHQQEVLQSVKTDKTFAKVIRDNGLPEQKIKYTYKTAQQKSDPKHPKPAGVPFKKWNYWLKVKTPEEAYTAANKFMFNLFKKEMYIYRARWVKHSKEFNPFLCEPKAVWELEVSSEDINQPNAFLIKWRTLVQTYKPSKAITAEWYKNTINNV